MAELADAPDLGSGARKAYGFKSLRPHQTSKRRIPAGVAHLVERSLAKAEVAGSSPVSRSNFYGGTCAAIKIGRDSEGIEAA